MEQNLSYITLPISHELPAPVQPTGIPADVCSRLADADRTMSLGRLVAGVAHEINNPSSFITINVHVLKGLYAGLVAELDARCSEQGDFPVGGLMYSQVRTDIAHLLDGIETGAHRIKDTVHLLQEYSRPGAAGLDQVVNLNDVVRSAARLLHTFVRRSTNQFETAYADALPAIKGNYQRLVQVVIALTPERVRSAARPRTRCPHQDAARPGCPHGGADHRGRRRRHSRGGHGACVRSVLHHEAGSRMPWPWPVRGAADPCGTSGNNRHRVATGRRHDGNRALSIAAIIAPYARMAMNTIKHPVLPIFLVDDESAARASMEILLRTASLGNTMQYADPREVMPALARQRASVILLDLGMPHIPGETLLQQIAAEYPAIPLLARHFLAEFAKEMGMPTPAIAKRLKRSKDEDET